MVQSLWKTVWRCLKKLIEVSYDPAIPLLGIYLEKMKTQILKDKFTPISVAALFTIAKTQKQPKFPSRDEQIKVCYTYIYIYTHTHIMGYYSEIKKNEITPFAAT